MLWLRSAVIALAVVISAGCISPQSYVDPQFRETKLGDVKPAKALYPTRLEVKFLRNGEPLPAVDEQLRGDVEKALAASGVLVVGDGGSAYLLTVVANNLGDVDEAFAKGFGAGLTFGAVGTTVTDYYEFQISLTDSQGKAISRDYKHAIHTVIGNDAAPVNGEQPQDLNGAFSIVVRDVVDNFLRAMQADGQLTTRLNIVPAS